MSVLSDRSAPKFVYIMFKINKNGERSLKLVLNFVKRWHLSHMTQIKD